MKPSERYALCSTISMVCVLSSALMGRLETPGAIMGVILFAVFSVGATILREMGR